MTASSSDTGVGLDATELFGMVQVLGPEEVFGNCKVSDLKHYCKRFGLKTIGCKLDIITCLAEYVRHAHSSASNATCAVAERPAASPMRSKRCSVTAVGVAAVPVVEKAKTPAAGQRSKRVAAAAAGNSSHRQPGPGTKRPKKKRLLWIRGQ